MFLNDEVEITNWKTMKIKLGEKEEYTMNSKNLILTYEFIKIFLDKINSIYENNLNELINTKIPYLKKTILDFQKNRIETNNNLKMYYREYSLEQKLKRIIQIKIGQNAKNILFKNSIKFLSPTLIQILSKYIKQLYEQAMEQPIIKSKITIKSNKK